MAKSSWGEYLKDFALMTTRTKKFGCPAMHHNELVFSRGNRCYIYLHLCCYLSGFYQLIRSTKQSRFTFTRQVFISRSVQLVTHLLHVRHVVVVVAVLDLLRVDVDGLLR